MSHFPESMRADSALSASYRVLPRIPLIQTVGNPKDLIFTVNCACAPLLSLEISP